MKVAIVNAYGRSNRGDSVLLDECIAEVRAVWPEAEITLVGAIDEEIRPILALYDGRFIHIPRVSPDKMPETLARYDVFVSTSLEEGLAVSICEAMGLAVVATVESGAGEVLEDQTSGLLFAATDRDALTPALTQLRDDRDYVGDIGQAALARTRSLVNWRGYAKRLEAIYDTL